MTAMRIPAISKTLIKILAVVAVVAVAFTTFVVTQDSTTGAGSKTTKVKSEEAALVTAAAEEAAFTCESDDLTCYNGYASDVFDKQGADALYQFVDEVTKLRRASLDCIAWLTDLGAKLYVRNGEKVFNEKAYTVCDGAIVAGAFVGVGSKATFDSLIADGAKICDAVGISKYECAFYSGFAAMKLTDNSTKVALGLCDKVVDRLGSRNCGTGITMYNRFFELKDDAAACASLKSPAAAGCANLIGGRAVALDQSMAKVCGSFMDIAKDDCEYGYGYFSGMRGGKISVCGESAWCARGLGWGTRTSKGEVAAKELCATFPEAQRRGCDAGTTMTIARESKSPDRPEPLTEKNFDGQLPKRS